MSCSDTGYHLTNLVINSSSNSSYGGAAQDVFGDIHPSAIENCDQGASHQEMLVQQFPAPQYNIPSEMGNCDQESALQRQTLPEQVPIPGLVDLVWDAFTPELSQNPPSLQDRPLTPNLSPVFFGWQDLYNYAPGWWKIAKYARYLALWFAFNYCGWWPEHSPPKHTARFALHVIHDLYVEKVCIAPSDDWPMPEKTVDCGNGSLIALIVVYMDKYIAQLAGKFEPYVHPPMKRAGLPPHFFNGGYNTHAPNVDGTPASNDQIRHRIQYLLESDRYMHSHPEVEDYSNSIIFDAIRDIFYFADGSLASIMSIMFQRFPGLAGHAVAPLQCHIPPNFLYLAGCMVGHCLKMCQNGPVMDLPFDPKHEFRSFQRLKHNAVRSESRDALKYVCQVHAAQWGADRDNNPIQWGAESLVDEL